MPALHFPVAKYPAILLHNLMKRLAIGDLLMDVELPASFSCSYEESGALFVIDDSNRFALRFSGLTVRGKDPHASNLCVKSTKEDAIAKRQEITSLRDDLVFYRYIQSSTSNEDPITDEFWIAGFGNRKVIATLSYSDSDRPFLSFEDLHEITNHAIGSVRLTYPLDTKPGDHLDVYALADSQRPWLEFRRTYLAEQIRRAVGYEGDGLIPLVVLDEYWHRFVASPPNAGHKIDAILNSIGVVFGDHLVQRKAFEWTIVSDAYGICIALVALRHKARVVTDPFNFVAKRWDRKEPTFLVAGFQGICDLVDENATRAGIIVPTLPEPNAPASLAAQPWWKRIWR